jgi:hypothetical protein
MSLQGKEFRTLANTGESAEGTSTNETVSQAYFLVFSPDSGIVNLIPLTSQ